MEAKWRFLLGSCEFAFTPRAVFVLAHYLIGLIAHKVMALWIGANIITIEQFCSLFFFIYTIIDQTFKETKNHQNNAYTSEYRCNPKTSSHFILFANAAKAPLPNVNIGEALRNKVVVRCRR